MPAQFIHYEDYAQKAGSYRKTTEFIFGEVRRQAPMSDHIATPRPPVIVYGASVEEVERFHNKKAREATIQVKGGRRRKIRTDQKTLASIVISHPYLLEDAEQDPKMMAELRSYEQNSINWLKDTFGNDLISVIRHDDEPHAHWHALILPLSDPEFKASKLHPGKVAKAKVMQDASLKKLGSKLLNKKGDMAYQTAMRDFQDSFYQKVSKQAGLTRLGPKLRRLTRAEWHLEKKQARSLREVMTEAKAYETQEVAGLREEVAQLKKVKAELEQALSESTVTVTSYSKDHATGEFNTTHKKGGVGLELSDDKPKPAPFKRPAYLLPRETGLQEQGGRQIVNSKWHKPSGAIVDILKPTKLHNVPSKVEEDWYDEEEANRKQEEHERFLENKSFTFYDLCKSPEADIFLQERARAAANARLANPTMNNTNAAPAQSVSGVTNATVVGKPVPSIVPQLGDETERTSEYTVKRSVGTATESKKTYAGTKPQPSPSISLTAKLDHDKPMVTVAPNGHSTSASGLSDKTDVKSSGTFQRTAYRTPRSERRPDLTSQPEVQVDINPTVVAVPELGQTGEQVGAINAKIQPASDNGKHNVKELLKTNEAQVIDPRSLAKRFREKFGAQRYKPRISLDGPSFGLSSSSQSPKTQEHQQPDANPIQQPNVRYTRIYRPDNAKLGLPLGYDPLARFRRKPKQELSPKPDQETPDNAPRRPTT